MIHEFLHEFVDVLRNSILITGLVLTMMMMLECLNIGSKGRILGGLGKNKPLQVVVSALLGSIPGCIGGFASVSLYTHGMLSFGALVAMMIATSGDEAFVMLSMMPGKAAMVFALLFVVAVLVGWLTDFYVSLRNRRSGNAEPMDAAAGSGCGAHYEIHSADEHESASRMHESRTFGLKRCLLFVGLALFLAALGLGFLEHEHAEHIHEAVHEHVHEHNHGINLLDEAWMNVLFAVLGIFVLVVIICASDHFVEEHLWDHVVRKHLGSIFLWTFGVLVLMEVLLSFVDVSAWISSNVPLMILLAALVGIIPESGPHLVFVTLYATGMVPLPVLLASCISQDGHASIPLLAENKAAFAKAKAINVLVALAAGYIGFILL